MSQLDSLDAELAHYGKKGMKWGVRTDRAAKKDATEFARAKMYYGEGAGVRRRLINNTVKAKSKDEAYRKAFDHHMSKQDMSKRASEARSKRKRTDIRKGTAKTTRGVVNVMKGNARYASAASILLVGAATTAHKTGLDRHLLNVGKTTLSAAMKSPHTAKIRNMFG